MDANLVGPPRARGNAAEGETAEALDDLVITARLLAVFLLFRDRHLDAVVRVAGDAALDVVAVAVEHAGRDRLILLEDAPLLELEAEVAVGHLVLGDQDDAAGVAVEAVHDPRAVVAAVFAELAEVEAQ